MTNRELLAQAAAPKSGWKKWRFIFGGAAIMLAIALLILSSARGATVYALTVSELKSRAGSLYGQGVRVSGTVDGDSIAWEANGPLLRFQLVEKDQRLSVLYRGARPDMLRDGAEALVEGKYQRDGSFEATKLLLKCPSKYEAAATATATK